MAQARKPTKRPVAKKARATWSRPVAKKATAALVRTGVGYISDQEERIRDRALAHAISVSESYPTNVPFGLSGSSGIGVNRQRKATSEIVKDAETFLAFLSGFSA